VTIRRFLFATAVVVIASDVMSQERPRRPPPGMPPFSANRGGGPIDLQRAVDIIRDWQQTRTAEGARVCRFQAVLNLLIEADRAIDPMQPNVSISKVNDKIAAAKSIVSQDRDPISFRLRSALITAGEIFDPHASPDLPSQRERFHRDVLDPAYRMVTPEVIAFVENIQQIDFVLKGAVQAESDMSALILHAIHGDCGPQQER